jgi:hypothetical protein
VLPGKQGRKKQRRIWVLFIQQFPAVSSRFHPSAFRNIRPVNFFVPEPVHACISGGIQAVHL